MSFFVNLSHRFKLICDFSHKAKKISLVLLFDNFPRMPQLINRHIGDKCLGHLDVIALVDEALSKHLDLDGDGGTADARQF